MSLQVLVIGIGTGNPDHLTREAINAMNRVDVFLVADKGTAKQDLVGLRTEICRQVIDHDHYRVIEVSDPDRGPDRDRSAAQYSEAVVAWHRKRAARYAEIIRAEVAIDGTVGFLVWGDPALYDSTIRIVETIRDHGQLDLELTVIPGISSLSLLAARHKMILNRVGQSIHITTGRRLVDEYDPGLGDVAVMLDGDLACTDLVRQHPGLTVFWGAQLGLPDEVLITGLLADVVEEIQRVRAEVRATRGWVMDTYLLRP
jgi:precorrin-6A synthase